MAVTQIGKLKIPWTSCVRCGLVPTDPKELTGEHVPPRSIYLDGSRPNPYIVVPLCVPCNSGTSLDDEHLVQVMTAASPGSEEARKLWREKVRPNIQRRPAHRVRLGGAVFPLPVRLPDGRQITFPGLAIEKERLNRSLEKMVRGLFWVHSRKLLPQEIDFTVEFYNILDLQSPGQALERMPLFQQCVPGLYRDAKSTRFFFYKGIFSEVPWGSLWYFVFYRQNIAAVLSTAPDTAETSTA